MSSRASARRSSAWETDRATDPAGLTPLAMDYASSLLGLLPGGRRTPGLKELLSKRRDLPAARAGRAHPRRRRVRRRGPPGPEAPVGRALHRAPGRRRRPSSPTCTSMRRHDHRGDPARRHRGHADAQGRDRRRASAPMSPSSSTASPSSTRSSSRAARRRRPRASARCCSRWCATCASSWSSSPTARTTCARSSAMPPAKRRAIARETLEIYAPIAEPPRPLHDQARSSRTSASRRCTRSATGCSSAR